MVIILFVVTQCMARYLIKVSYKYNLISLMSPLSWISGWDGDACQLHLQVLNQAKREEKDQLNLYI